MHFPRVAAPVRGMSPFAFSDEVAVNPMLSPAAQRLSVIAFLAPRALLPQVRLRCCRAPPNIAAIFGVKLQDPLHVPIAGKLPPRSLGTFNPHPQPPPLLRCRLVLIIT